MGSKKYQNKRCVYCSRDVKTTADHVICREFFPLEFRTGLPKAPACEKCNLEKSKLETYLTAVLPFGSEHPAALIGQKDSLRRRLNHRPSLRKDLADGSKPFWVQTASGLIVPSSGIPFEGQKLTDYLRYAVRGLTWYEWASIVPEDYLVEVFTLAPQAYAVFKSTVLSLGSGHRISRSFAGGAFRYVASRSPNDPALSTWNIWFYEDLGIGGTLDGKNYHRLEIVSITGPPEMKDALSTFTAG